MWPAGFRRWEGVGYGTDRMRRAPGWEAGLGAEWGPGFLGGLPRGAQSPGDCGPAPLSAALPPPLGDAVTSCLSPDPDSQSQGALHGLPSENACKELSDNTCSRNTGSLFQPALLGPVTAIPHLLQGPS